MTPPTTPRTNAQNGHAANGLLPATRPRVAIIKPGALPPLCVGLKDAARLLGISDVHFNKFVKSGEVPHVWLGGRLVFRVASLDCWLAERETKIDGDCG